MPFLPVSHLSAVTFQLRWLTTAMPPALEPSGWRSLPSPWDAEAYECIFNIATSTPVSSLNKNIASRTQVRDACTPGLLGHQCGLDSVPSCLCPYVLKFSMKTGGPWKCYPVHFTLKCPIYFTVCLFVINPLHWSKYVFHNINGALIVKAEHQISIKFRCQSCS